MSEIIGINFRTRFPIVKHPSALISIMLSLLLAFLVAAPSVAAPTDEKPSVPCPTFTPLHGLLPILMWLGILPKPVMASTIAPSDTSTSIVIHPDPNDQITCGKTGVRTIEDVVFARRAPTTGKSVDLLLDVQMPQSPGKKPLVVYVTGGGFIRAPKEAALNLRTYVAEAGFVVASVQYRTITDGANYRDGVADVKSAIRYLRANADRYGIDPSRVAVWGESAGGYIAAMVGVTNGVKTFDIGDNLDQRSDVQAVIDKFGASDTSTLFADFDSQARDANNAKGNPIAQYIGLDPTTHLLDTRVATTDANPLTYIKAGAPPFLIFHGSQDRLVSPSQTLTLHKALIAAGANSTRYVLEGAGHGDLSFLGDTKAGLPWSTNQTMRIMVDFLRQSIAREATPPRDHSTGP
jgi:acetyl esterase/lipase